MYDPTSDRVYNPRTGQSWPRWKWYFQNTTSLSAYGNKRQKCKLYMCCWDLIEGRRREILDKMHKDEMREYRNGWLD